MHSMQTPASPLPVRAAAHACQQPAPELHGLGAWGSGTVHDALNELARIVSDPCFASPPALTQDVITAYALTLIRLRECASAEGLERLTNACDAIAVTVSRLIENRSVASSANCVALIRFAMHAREMIPARTNVAALHPST